MHQRYGKIYCDKLTIQDLLSFEEGKLFIAKIEFF